MPEVTQPIGNELGHNTTSDGKAPWGALWTLAAGLALIIIDSSIVNVSLPAIIDDLGIDLTDAQWVNTLYNIVLAALLLPFGHSGDARGRKRFFESGIIIFVFGSTLAAASTAAGMLLAARAVQGVGAAMIMPSTLSTISASFRGKDRAAAFGVWGAVMSGAAAVGPLLGGVLTTYASWHWIFLINLPLGLLVFLAGLRFVPETRRTHSAADATAQRTHGDVLGVILSVAASALLVFGLIEGESLGWWAQKTTFTIAGLAWPTSWPSVAPMAIVSGVVFAIAFAMHESNRIASGKTPMLDVTLFRIPTFAWGNLTATAVAAGQFALIFALPLFMVNAAGLSSFTAGLILAAMAIGALISGGSARFLAARLGIGNTVLVGLLLEIVGAIAAIPLLQSHVNMPLMVTTLIIYGVGLGLASAQLTSIVLADVPIRQSGEASATQSTVRQLGSALGAAISGTVLAIAANVALPKRLETLQLPSDSVDSLVTAVSSSAGSAIGAMRSGQAPDELVSALAAGFSDAAKWTVGIAVVMLVLGFVGACIVAWHTKHAHTEQARRA